MTQGELAETFAGFPDRFAQAARASETQPITDGEWGPAENVRHLIAVEAEVWQVRLARVAAEDDPQWAWSEPGPPPGFEDAALEAILAAFATARAVTTASLRALDNAGWARHGTHATYGRLDVEGLLRIAIDHDASHLEQLQRT